MVRAFSVLGRWRKLQPELSEMDTEEGLSVAFAKETSYWLRFCQ